MKHNDLHAHANNQVQGLNSVGQVSQITSSKQNDSQLQRAGNMHFSVGRVTHQAQINNDFSTGSDYLDKQLAKRQRNQSQNLTHASPANQSEIMIPIQQTGSLKIVTDQSKGDQKESRNGSNYNQTLPSLNTPYSAQLMNNHQTKVSTHQVNGISTAQAQNNKFQNSGNSMNHLGGFENEVSIVGSRAHRFKEKRTTFHAVDKSDEKLPFTLSTPTERVQTDQILIKDQFTDKHG